MWPFQSHLDEASHRDRDHQLSRGSGKVKFEIPPMCGLYEMQYHINSKEADGGAESEELADASVPAQKGYEALKTKMDKELLSGSEYIDHFSYLSLSEAQPFVCESSDVHIKTTRRTTAYQVIMRFTRPPALGQSTDLDKDPLSNEDETENKNNGKGGRQIPPWYSLFFPFSECGPKVESFQVQVNKFPVFGEVVRARRRDGRLIPSTEKATFIAETSDLDEEKEDASDPAVNVPATEETPEKGGKDADKKTEASSAEAKKKTTTKAPKAKPLLYYYVVDPIHLEQILQLPGALADTKKESSVDVNTIEVEVTWRCRTEQLQGATVYVPFSFYCAPCRPQRLTCHVEVDKESPPLKEVKSPSCQQNLLYLNTRYMKERRAAHVAVESVTPTDSIAAVLSDKEDLFLFIIQLGENTLELSEEVSFFGITAIAIVVLLVIWFLLTKDLQF